MVSSFFVANLPFFVFVGLLIGFILVNRENLEVEGVFPFFYVLLYKTKWGFGLMERLSKVKGVRWFYLLSIFVGIFGSVFTFFFMIYNLRYIYLNRIQSGGGFVLPLKTSSSLVYYVPFVYWIISIFVLVTVHEMAHGVVSRFLRVKIKSSGFAFLGVLLPLLPLAFVEPDEEVMKRLNWRKHIGILGAGPTINIVLGFLFLGIFLVVGGYYGSHSMVSSVTFNGITNESPLYKYNLSGAFEILSVNNATSDGILRTLFNLSLDQEYVLKVKSLSDKRVFTLVAKPYNASGKIRLGINNVHIERQFVGNSILGVVLEFIVNLLYYLWLLNLSIGLINLLPLWITDGGQILRILLVKGLGERRGILLFHLVSYMSLMILLLNIFPKVMF